MPRPGWSNQRLRQYDATKEGLRDRGRDGETSTDDISSGPRGGLRSHSGAAGRTKAQLYAEARRQGVAGRSTMSKAELERAVSD